MTSIEKNEVYSLLEGESKRGKSSFMKNIGNEFIIKNKRHPSVRFIREKKKSNQIEFPVHLESKLGYYKMKMSNYVFFFT